MTMARSAAIDISDTEDELWQRLFVAQQNCEKLTTLFNDLPAGLVILDGNGCIQQCNEIAKTIARRTFSW